MTAPCMYVLYTADHQARGVALAAETPRARHGDIDGTSPMAVPGLDTLTFWGHCNMTDLCGKSSKELYDLITRWKKHNPALKTVELITCNARHCNGQMDPYANRLKSHLKWGIFKGT